VLSSEQRIAELAGEVAALQEQLAGALGALQEARSEGGALRDELGALGEDMQALVRENQVGGRAGHGTDALRYVWFGGDQQLQDGAMLRQTSELCSTLDRSRSNTAPCGDLVGCALTC
jgi:hypothetical protein